VTDPVSERVAALLDDPPLTPADLRTRLKGVDRGRVTSEMARRLVDAKSHPVTLLLLIRFLVELGPGKASTILLDAAGDSGLSMRSRAVAAIVLMNRAPEKLARRMASLGADEINALMQAAFDWLAVAERSVREPRKKESGSRAAAPARACRLKVTLRGIRPAIWRRFEVLDSIHMGQLHRVIQEVMGWTDSHLHEFGVGQQTIGIADPEAPETIDEKRVRLRDLVDRGVRRFSYTYDFGDFWQHEIAIEKSGPKEKDVPYPRCISGRRACPPEDCGGVPGYDELTAALSDPAGEEYDHLREWAGEWNSQAFDPEVVNRRLRTMR
jgi:hypothetical protein